MINEALRFAPKNESYLLTKLDLFFRIKMYYSARGIAQKILEINPNSARANYALGYLREMIWVKYRNMHSSHPAAEITFHLSDFVEDDLNEAIGYYNRATMVDPKDNNSYYRLAFIYYETDEINKMINFFQYALEINPDDMNYYLFLGLAYRKQNHLDKAWAQFEQAKSLMQPQELALFESGDLIAEYGEQDSFKVPGEKEIIQKAFWKKKDPLFLTEVNERKLEHYCRIAYANLRFSRLHQGIEGWKTPQGQALIRFGPPLGNSLTWATIDDNMDGVFPVNLSNEVWSYPGFTIRFEDRNLDGVYEFYNKDSYNTIVKKHPEMFDFIRPHQKILVSCSVADFQHENNLSSVEIYQNIINNPLDETLETRKGFIKRGVYIFDQEWNEVRSIVSSKPNYYSFNEMLIGWNHLQLPPGDYYLVVEFMNQETEMIGRWRQDLTIESYDKQNLAISDIVLAWNFGDFTEEKMLQKNDIGILPNALGVYVENPVVHIYFELYNLALFDDKSNYRITYTIEPDDKNKTRIGKFAQKLLGKDKKSEQVAISTEYSGNSSNDFLYHTLTLAKPTPGEYHLNIEVLDLNSYEKTVKRKTFTLKDSEK